MKDILKEKLRRTEILAHVMNGEKKNKADFAFYFNVSEITINRDLEWLRSLGVQIYSRNKLLTITQNPSKEVLNLLAAEYLPIKMNSDIFLKKIKTLNNARFKKHFNFLILLAKAVNEQTFIQIEYKRLSDDEKNIYLLKPIKLLNEGYNWILHAFKDGEDILKTFYLSRIEQFVFLHNKFKLDPFLEVNKKNEKIILKFSPEVENELYYKIWFDEFEIEKDEKGNISIKTNQTVTNKLAAWCISWWDKIEIIEPQSLKDRCKGMIKMFLENN